MFQHLKILKKTTKLNITFANFANSSKKESIELIFLKIEEIFIIKFVEIWFK